MFLMGSVPDTAPFQQCISAFLCAGFEHNSNANGSTQNRMEM